MRRVLSGSDQMLRVPQIGVLFSNIYPIFIEEVLKILNNMDVAKCLSISSLSCKILPKILL